MDPLHPMSFWCLVARLDMDIYPYESYEILWICCLIQATISSLNKQHLTCLIDRLANTAWNSACICQSQILNNEIISGWKGNIEKNLSIGYGFPSGTRLMGILRIHLIIFSTECSWSFKTKNRENLKKITLVPIRKLLKQCIFKIQSFFVTNKLSSVK